MSTTPEPDLAKQTKEHWGSKLGVVLAVAGSAVGLGNFLRFPSVAAANGGGVFMVPYLLSFLLLGIPICWCEWTMGRLGARYGQNNGPGIMFALWRRAPAKLVGAITLMVPLGVYMYYVVVEAWCLDYCYAFFSGEIAREFAGLGAAGEAAGAVVAASGNYFESTVGMNTNGALLDTRMLWMVLICFAVNFVIIYRGVTKGIETFCKIAMPLLIACALIILVRALTLPDVVTVGEDGSRTVRTVSDGLGFMWNPQWEKLWDPKVWLAASGQIFFSLSVGFGLILCYASYVKKDEDVVLSSLSASSTNEFCEVILGGMIIIPCAFLFLGPANATGGTFGLGFVTMPAIMHFMPGGQFFGGMWFGLLFLAAVTSSLSMLQPAIAFLEDAFGVGRATSVTMLGVLTLIGAAPIFYFTHNLTALDHTDFWCNFLMIVAATAQVLIFGWVIGAEKGVREANRGADFPLPRFMPFVIRFVTPTFLIVILVAWFVTNGPDYLEGMNAELKGSAAARGVYEAAVGEHFADSLTGEALEAKKIEILGDLGVPQTMPDWLMSLGAKAEESREIAAKDARVARYVFVSVLLFLALLVAVSDIACRKRIGRVIAAAQLSESGLELT